MIHQASFSSVDKRKLKSRLLQFSLGTLRAIGVPVIIAMATLQKFGKIRLDIS